MTANRRADYATDDILVFDELNRYSINGSPQWISTQTISGSSYIWNITNVFTSYYDNYRIVIHYLNTSGGAPGIRFRWLIGTLAQTAATYYHAGEQTTAAGVTTALYSTAVALTYTPIGTATFSGFGVASASFDVQSPNIGTKTSSFSGYIATPNNGWASISSLYTTAIPADGFRLYSDDPTYTLTGSVSVYAWRNGSA